MPGKWQIVNGVRYPIEDHASPRSTPEEYNPYDDPVFQRRIASLQADMRGSKKGGTLDDNLYPNHPYNTRKSEVKGTRRSVPKCMRTPNHPYNTRKGEVKGTRRSVPKCMRTRTGTDYRKINEHRAAITIQKHFRGMIVRNLMSTATSVENSAAVVSPAYEQRSMLDRWSEGAEMIVTPEEPKCHPTGWTEKNHYSELGWQWCGQSCPCCRAQAGDTLGACPICTRRR